MTETDFQRIQEKLKKYKYSSMQYLEYKEVSKYEVINEEEEIILLTGFHEKEACKEYHWAANTSADVLTQIRDSIPCFITFVPEEWVQDFEKAGFKICAAFCDYFMNSLEGVPDSEEGEFLKIEESGKAAAVTMACRGQSRGFNGETTEWIEEWLDNTKGLGCEAEYLHRAVFIERNEQKEIVGLVVTALYGYKSKRGIVSWIREVAVKPEYQRRGIARRLIIQALNYGKKHGATKAFLAADACNVHAIHLYESIGFKGDIDKQINMLKEAAVS